MKTVKFFGFPILIVGLLIISTIPFQGCQPEDDDINDSIVVYKPNIYIYPQEKTTMSVKINFPEGGEIIESIPDYGNGWNITVDTNGLIDNSYSYLFYESIQPAIWQQKEGWIIKKTDLKGFFNNNLAGYGFFGQEIHDFNDYWIPRLTGSEFYAIYPQNKMIIENVIKLSFSKEPDNLLRLFYVIQEVTDIPSSKPAEPKVNKLFEREKFFVVEWGVILK